MPDHDAAPDPIDQAYVRAEAVLSDDDDARAARRARVLAAVAREAAAPAATFPAIRRPGWRRGGWLAAASVAGLGLFFTAHLYAPAPHQPFTEPVAPAVPIPVLPTPESRRAGALPTPSAKVTSRTPKPAPRIATPPSVTPSEAGIPPVAPPPPLSIPPAPQAFPAAVAPAPPPAVRLAAPADLPPPPRLELPPMPKAPPPPAPIVSAARSAAAPIAATQRPLVRGAFAASPPAAPLTRLESSAGLLADPAARLRAASTAGRTAEMEALLAQGIPVDAPDADGNTALMNSIRADHPAAAALLRRHGASLDHRNHAGESARDMATAKGDAALNQAISLDP
jgi:hypothetical protein